MDLSVQESYDIIAKYFSNTRVYTWKWTDNFIINATKNSFILDIGSGNGRNSKYNNHIIFTLDISMEQLKMNNNINKKDIHGNMILLPFKDETFDYILSIASFHHLKTDKERNECLKEMKRVLKNKGKMILSVWSIKQPSKIKRTFNKYGDTIVNWNTNKKDNNKNYIIIPRYYYIFEIENLKKMLEKYFIIDKYYWDCGNEIFELTNNI